VNEYLFTVIIERQPEGEYLVSVPALPGCYTEKQRYVGTGSGPPGRVVARPGRDPRDDLPSPLLRQDALQMEDLQVGMRLRGTVRNVVDLSAFVEIGIKQDSLVHISKMADHYVRDPFAVVSVGDLVDVTVTSVDLERGRIDLRLQE
jgi:translation initiation factor IF-1